jgi:hypothetical protein
MSYSELKPEYYRMFQPDSPWHAGSEGWSTAPWPGWGRNPNLVGQSRVGVNGLGAYYANKFEQPISGLGKSGCGCKGIGDTAATPVITTTTSNPAPWVIAAFAVGAMSIAYFAMHKPARH